MNWRVMNIKAINKGSANKQLQQWNILNEDLSLPLAVLYQSRIENNLKWMQAFADHYQVKLAPHGKTTMTPELFNMQKQSGAWAITLATATQVSAAYSQGIKRIIMANQLVGKQNMRLIADLMKDDQFEFYCLVDSLDNIKQLAAFFSAQNLTLNILIEIGVAGGRCGCRTNEQINALVTEIKQHHCLSLAGIEVYEGVIHGDNAASLIKSFLKEVIKTTQNLLKNNDFDTEQVILTGAGSAWYDVVAETFSNADLSQNIIPVIRPGCYLIHDTGIYLNAQDAVIQRNQVACDLAGDLQSSLEIWAYVQSIPEPGHIIIGMGKRDVAFDAGLPIPELHYRPENSTPTSITANWKITDVMDQHAYLSCPVDSDIKVGDMIAFSTSHPCLTFDKWREIALIDNNFNVKKLLKTYF